MSKLNEATAKQPAKNQAHKDAPETLKPDPKKGETANQDLKHETDKDKDSHSPGPVNTGSTKRPADKEKIKAEEEERAELLRRLAAIDEEKDEDDEEEDDEDEKSSDDSDDSDDEEEDMEEGYMTLEDRLMEAFDKIDLEYEIKADTSDVSSLFEQAELSEEIKEQATTILEAAVNKASKLHIVETAKKVIEAAREAAQVHEEQMTDKVDGYLNRVVAEWTEENKMAIESNIRTEIAESFIESLKEVFAEHYVEVPESKLDLVDELAEQVNDLESRLNSEIDKNVKLSEQMNLDEKTRAINEFVEDMNDVDAEKVRDLAEDLDFGDKDKFKKKLNIIKEAVQSKKVKTLDESVEPTNEGVTITEQPDDFVSALASQMSNLK